MKKNLNNLRCYLAGPIEFAPNPIDHSSLVSFLNDKGVKVLDPKKISFGGEVSELTNRKELFENEQFDIIRNQMKKIVRKDLRCVDISDFIIAFLPKDVRTTGTIHEIIEADRQRKPVLLICPEGIKYIPAWLFGIIPLRYMFDSINSTIDYLQFINNSHNLHQIDERWQLILNCITLNETNC